MVADRNRCLLAPLPGTVPAQRIIGVLPDWPAHSGRRIEPAIAVLGVAAVRAQTLPGKTAVCGKIRDLSARLGKGIAVCKNRDACTGDACANPPGKAEPGPTTGLDKQ
jgi:hypothetical protein